MSTTMNQQADLLFKDAFEKLEGEILRTSPQNAVQLHNTTLLDVHNACREIEQKLAQRRCLRNMSRVLPFLQCLDHYSKVVEVACNGTQYLPWIWAPVKLILQMASDYPAVLEKLVATYAKIAEILPRFDRLAQTFKMDSNFQKVLAMVYSDILDFHREAHHFFTKRGLKLFICSLGGWFDRRFKGLLDQLAEHCSLVDIQAKTIDIVEATMWRKRFHDEIQDEFTKTEKERAVQHLQACLTWLDIKDDEQENELDRFHSQIHQGSCDWIPRHDKCRSWLSMAGTQSILWLNGKPGAGKSVISSTMIQFLKQDGLSTVLYYFCIYQSAPGDRSAHILRTFVAQLLRSNTDMASYIYNGFIVTGQSTSKFTLKRILQSLLATIPSVRILVDGVDELSDDEQIRVLEDVMPFASVQNTARICKILISSRDTTDIGKVMSRRPTLNLNAERKAVDASIRSFIHQNLTGIRGNLVDSQNGSGSTMDDIEQELIEKAEGMFLWVRLVVSALCKAGSLSQLRILVRELPKGMERMYDRISARVFQSSTTRERSMVISTLSFLVHARRPLKRFELTSAIRLRFDSGVADNSAEWDWVLDLCKPLVEVTRHGTVIFIHSTAHEYFVKGLGSVAVCPRKAALEISLACLACLIRGIDLLDPGHRQGNNASGLTSGLYHFCKYAVDFWATHLLAVLVETREASETDTLIRYLDVLHERHQLVQSVLRRDQAPLGRYQSSECACPSLQAHPHLLDFVQRNIHFEKTLRSEQFSSGNDIDDFRLEHDTTLLSEFLQKHRRFEMELQGHDNHLRSALYCRFWGCGSFFRIEQELVDHESLHLGGIKCPSETCSFSRVGFTSASALKRHIRAYHPVAENVKPPAISVRRPHVCSGILDGVIWGCGQRFKLPEELSSHWEKTTCNPPRSNRSTEQQDPRKIPRIQKVDSRRPQNLQQPHSTSQYETIQPFSEAEPPPTPTPSTPITLIHPDCNFREFAAKMVLKEKDEQVQQARTHLLMRQPNLTDQMSSHLLNIVVGRSHDDEESGVDPRGISNQVPENNEITSPIPYANQNQTADLQLLGQRSPRSQLVDRSLLDTPQQQKEQPLPDGLLDWENWDDLMQQHGIGVNNQQATQGNGAGSITYPIQDITPRDRALLDLQAGKQIEKQYYQKQDPLDQSPRFNRDPHIFTCHSLSIGSWRCVSGTDMDIAIFYSLNERLITYRFGEGKRIEYPFSSIISITSENSSGSGFVGGLIVVLNRPPKFYSSPQFGEVSEVCDDFTKDRQASRVRLHYLRSNSKNLGTEIVPLVSSEAFQNRHILNSTSEAFPSPAAGATTTIRELTNTARHQQDVAHKSKRNQNQSIENNSPYEEEQEVVREDVRHPYQGAGWKAFLI